MKKILLVISFSVIVNISFAQIYGNEGETDFYLKFERDTRIVNNVRALYVMEDFIIVGIIDLVHPFTPAPSALFYRKKDIERSNGYANGKFYTLPMDEDNFNAKMYYKIKCDCDKRLFTISEYGFVHKDDKKFPDLDWLSPKGDKIFTRMYEVVCDNRDFLTLKY